MPRDEQEAATGTATGKRVSTASIDRGQRRAAGPRRQSCCWRWPLPDRARQSARAPTARLSRRVQSRSMTSEICCDEPARGGKRAAGGRGHPSGARIDEDHRGGRRRHHADHHHRPHREGERKFRPAPRRLRPAASPSRSRSRSCGSRSCPCRPCPFRRQDAGRRSRPSATMIAMRPPALGRGRAEAAAPMPDLVHGFRHALVARGDQWMRPCWLKCSSHQWA